MIDFFIRLGKKRCQHKNLLDISKYRKDNYYQDLLGKYDQMASVEVPMMEAEESLDNKSVDGSISEEVQVVSKKPKGVKQSAHSIAPTDTTKNTYKAKKNLKVLEMIETP
jgi:hypothetical protein